MVKLVDAPGQRAPPMGAAMGERLASQAPKRLSLTGDVLVEAAPFVIVAIGASAGGLDACTQLIDALPPMTGMAFILIQHLDPSHESLLAGLLATHTPMVVEEAVDGISIAPQHVYVIPPGAYLAVQDGVLRLSKPVAPHGVRLPFDFLLNSLADACATRAACIILSGTGTDGSSGLVNLKERGGLIIVQAPDSAEYDGMPRSAIDTGVADLILPIAQMPAALADFADKVATVTPAAVIELLRTTTPHDFRRYKPGTLQRRIARRIEMAGIPLNDMALLQKS